MPRKKVDDTKITKTAAKPATGARLSASKGKQSSEEKKPTRAKSGAVRKKNEPKTAKEEKTEAATSNSLKEVIYSLNSGSPIYVKTADICNATGKTNQWIGQLTSQGVIFKTKTKYGQLYELFETMRNYCAMLEERSKSKDETLSQAELRKKQADADYKDAKAKLAKMETEEFEGKIHRSEDVQAMTIDLLYYVRGSLMALAGRCANKCAATDEPAEVQKIINTEVSEILIDLSRYKYSRERYDELVRKRMKKELDADYFSDEEEE